MGNIVTNNDVLVLENKSSENKSSENKSNEKNWPVTVCYITGMGKDYDPIFSFYKSATIDTSTGIIHCDGKRLHVIMALKTTFSKLKPIDVLTSTSLYLRVEKNVHFSYRGACGEGREIRINPNHSIVIT